MYLIVDRIEKGFAVCENGNGETCSIPLTMLPKGLSEGDAIKLSVDKNERESREKRIKKLMDNIWSE